MTLVARGPGGERLDITLFDEDTWHTIRTEPYPLSCEGCGGPMHTKAYRLDDPRPDEAPELRIFSHNPGAAERCRMLGGEESPEHHRLKRRLAQGARRAGWTADLEVQPSPDCRADVVATNPITGKTRALEAQLARLSHADALLRHQRYVDQFGDCTWTHTGTREWSTEIPSLRVDSASNELVVGGIITDLADETSLPPTDLLDVVPEILSNRIVYVFSGGWGTYLTRAAIASGRAPRARRRRRLTSAGATRFCDRMAALGDSDRSLLSYGFTSVAEFQECLIEAHVVFDRDGWRELSEHQWMALALAGEHPAIKEADASSHSMVAELQVTWN